MPHLIVKAIKSMNKKTLMIVANITFLLLVIGIVFILTRPTTTKIPKENNSSIEKPFGNTATNVPLTQTTPESEKLTIPTNDGESLLVINFYKSPYTKIFDSENDALIIDNPNYQVIYYARGGFVISLLWGDLPSVRTESEQAFIKKLGITEEKACRLSVSLGVAPEASEKAAGRNYKLSFCPDGKPLPKNL